MGIVDLPFVTDLESRMQIIQEREYARMAASENQWWAPFMKVRPSQSRKELIFWILSTAAIELQGKGGNVRYDDMSIMETDFTALDAGKGLEIRRQQFEDLDGNGIQVATEWTEQISAYAAYWPQKMLANLILKGEGTSVATCYDGLPFFSQSHLLNPQKAGVGTFANLFTGAASGGYPGALKIDESVTVDVALANVGKAIAYIKSIKMPSGKDPRFLVPKFLVAPPALQTRAVTLTDAKFISMSSNGGGGGTTDVEGVIKRWGLNTPVIAPEFASSITGDATDDTSWYIGCEQMTSSQLGAFVYVNREPFAIQYYTGQDGANVLLARAQKLEWLTHGRNLAGPGHPYAFFKFKAA
jgi:hypothetical protein